MPPLHYCVFSFNRGPFLRHCVASIEQCAPGAPVTVFDDDSSDPETREVLADIARRHEVRTPGGAYTGKHGGLTGNMQAALDHVAQGRACFLQDDMQLVRPVDATDHAAIDAWFTQRPNAAFLHPAFLKGCNRSRDLASTHFDAASGCYLRQATTRSAGRHYSDIFIADVDRLRVGHWQFHAKEGQNDAQAKARFGAMGFLFAPFVMWLPQVPAYRGRVKTRALSRAERKQPSGFFPLSVMGAADVARLRARPVEQLPVAEDYLRAPHAEVRSPWRYHPLQGERLLRTLDRLERRLAR